jgi:nicotinate-nucleotide adenylyltransferase
MIDEIMKYLEKNIDSIRMEHVHGVTKTAIELSRLYGCDENKAYLASLLHDVAKNRNKDEFLHYIKNDDSLKNNEVFLLKPSLCHGYIAAKEASEKFNIHDEDILNALKYHTTGRPNMSLLEKIIYVSDYIDPTRKFEGVEILRTLAFDNIDIALKECLKESIMYLVKTNNKIDKLTIDTYNFYVKKEK